MSGKTLSEYQAEEAKAIAYRKAYYLKHKKKIQTYQRERYQEMKNALFELKGLRDK